jgi:hypothetical protein
MARKSAAGRRVGDAMVTYPKTHGPGSGLAEIRAFLEDDHVHMALIVAAGGRLVTTIERPDLAATTSSSVAAAKLGTLIGRTAEPADPLVPRPRRCPTSEPAAAQQAAQSGVSPSGYPRWSEEAGP